MASRSAKTLLPLALIALAAGPGAWAQSRPTAAQLAELDRVCEEARLVKLAPLRQEKIEQCLREGRKTRAECTSAFAEWGNTRALAGGGARAGLFYDLPECQAAFDARQGRARR